MTKEEKQRWDNLEKGVSEIRSALVGNTELGLRGLVERQQEDELFQQKVTGELHGIQASLRKVHSQQKSTTELQAQMDDRLKKVETFTEIFQMVWKSLKPGKKTLAWLVGIIASILSGLALIWQNFKH
jgi:predicted phage-related endonuclease